MSVAHAIPPALTIPRLKAFNRSPRTSAMRLAVHAARKAAAETRAKVDAYVAPIFARYTFADDEGKPITDPANLYLSEDADACAKFYADCIDAHNAHGYNLGESCPALVAENAAAAAERALVAYADEILGTCFATTWKLDAYKRALSLFLQPCE